jgi:hypothetical protein
VKQFIGLGFLVFVGVAAWRIGGSLSGDALGMAVGVLFGVLAGLPAALLVMAAGRRREVEREEQPDRRRLAAQHGGYGPGYGPGYGAAYPQPPVIVLAGAAGPAPQPYSDPYAGQPRYALPAPRETVDVRQFKVIGEKEEWVDEW